MSWGSVKPQMPSMRAIEQALTDLGSRVDEPDVDVAASVARRLARPPPPPSRLSVSRAGRALARRPRFPRSSLRPVIRPGWHTAAAAALVLVVAAAGVLTASPGARQAVAGLLGVRGVEVRVVPSPPSPPTPDSRSGTLALGRPVTLAEAQARVEFPILLPTAPGFEAPDGVHVVTLGTGRQVLLVFAPREGLPEVAGTGAGLLLVEFRAELDETALQKKIAGPDTSIRPVAVDGAPGLWIEGAPHSVMYLDEQGGVIEDTVRLAGNVLLWERGDLTLRLESALGLDEALRIAETVG